MSDAGPRTEGRASPGGTLPVNTTGGGLSYTHTGMYGIFAVQECVRQLRAQFPESRVPIVAVTADAVEESREKCLNNGFTAWISKPFRVEQLAGLLDEYSPGNAAFEARAAGG